jgi:hypothetical protein
MRVAAVEQGIIAAFKAAVDHLGDEEACRQFLRVTRRPKRGPGKALAPDRNFRLLREYDGRLKGETVAALSKRLLKDQGQGLGNTEGAIAAQIRKLVKERKERERAAVKEARRWRMATRHDPPTVLSGRSEK